MGRSAVEELSRLLSAEVIDGDAILESRLVLQLVNCRCCAVLEFLHSRYFKGRVGHLEVCPIEAGR